MLVRNAVFATISRPPPPILALGRMLLVRKLSVVICLAALIALAGYLYVQTKVDSAVTQKIVTLLNDQLRPVDLVGSLDDAKFVQNQGLRLTDLRIADPLNRQRPILEVYKAFVHLPVTLTELVTLKPKPQGLEFKRAKLHLVIQRDGSFNIQPLIDLVENQSPSNGFIPVRMTDSTIDITDVRNNQSYAMENVAVKLEPIRVKSRTVAKLSVSLTGDFIDSFDTTFYLDPQTEQWVADVNHWQLNLSKELVELAPQALKKQYRIDSIFGKIAIAGRVSGSLKSPEKIPVFNIKGRVQNLEIDSPQLPVSIRSTQANFSASQQGFAIDHANGRAEDGSFDVSYRQTGFLTRTDWALSGKCENIDFKHRMLDAFPEYCQKFYREYSPDGRFDLAFQLDSFGKKSIQAKILDMSFNYHRFPYPLEHCSGTVNWTGEICEFKLNAPEEGQQLISIAGYVKNPGPLATYSCDIKTEGDLSINEKLMRAIDAFPKLSPTVRAFRATGRISCRGRIEKQIPGAPLAQKSFDIKLSDCTTRHTHFDYPVHNVSGVIRMRNSDFQFENVKGNNNSTNTTCNGVWNKAEGLQLRFICNDVSLDGNLRTALPSSFREIWDGFRPSGTIALASVDLLLPPNAPNLDVRIDARLSSTQKPDGYHNVAIKPTWFPYELNQLTGRIKIGEGEVHLEQIRGRHGRGWLSANGYGQYDDRRWQVRLSDILAGSLPVDDDLIKALPKALGESVRLVEYKGLVTVNGGITLSGQNSGYAPVEFAQVSYPANIPSTDPSFRFSWNMRFDMEQAEVNLGLPIENIFGQVSVQGEYFNGQTRCRGEVAMDSLTVYGIQVTNLTGPLWIDSAKVLAGVYTSHVNPADEKRSIVGNVFGGQIRLDSHLLFEGDAPFRVDTTIANANLQDVAAEVAPQFRDMKGKGLASFQMIGNCVDWNSLYGIGNIQLRDAEIYQLPVVLSLLKILRVKEVTTTAFDTSNINFRLTGDQIELQRIELIGDAISLIGNGKLNLARDIDLNFYSVVGRNNYIPLLSELVELGAQQIMWININGNLDNPQTHQNFLPYLNESIKQLFQTPAQSTLPGRTGSLNIENR